MVKLPGNKASLPARERELRTRAVGDYINFTIYWTSILEFVPARCGVRVSI